MFLNLHNIAFMHLHESDFLLPKIFQIGTKIHESQWNMALFGCII